MAKPTAADKVDYRLLERLSNLVICSRCLSEGRVTPVPQILSPRHTPRSLCPDCTKPRRRNLRRVLTRLADL
jgi:superfamily II helicase